MQHHGAPTRLLDLSRSPFISAYFAFEQCCPELESHVAIWGINIEYLKNKSLQILSAEFGDALDQSKQLINEYLFKKYFITTTSYWFFLLSLSE